jgi:hypothetical protein
VAVGFGSAIVSVVLAIGSAVLVIVVVVSMAMFVRVPNPIQMFVHMKMRMLEIVRLIVIATIVHDCPRCGCARSAALDAAPSFVR